MTPDELSSIDNGIWMCYRHGKQIDADETRFTIPMLKRWREVAELRARLSHELGREIDFGPEYPARLPLAETSITLFELGAKNGLIGDALCDSCVGAIWGEDLGHAVRDLAIEVVRNAFQHGGATQFKLVVEPNRVELIDNGCQFAAESLLACTTRTGGAESVKQINRRHGNRVVVSSRFEDGLNKTVVALVNEPAEVSQLTPCAVEFDARELHKRGFKIPVLEYCETTYIVMPIFISYSDAFKLAAVLSEEPLRGRKYVIVSRFSPGVASHLKTLLPDCQLMNLEALPPPN